MRLVNHIVGGNMREWLTDLERARIEKGAWMVKLEASVLGGMLLFLMLSFLFEWAA